MNIQHIGRFEDLEGGLPDTEAEEYLDLLKHNKIPQYLGEEEVVDSSIQWLEKGVDLENSDHSQYLEQVSNDFFNKVSEQIQK